MEIALPEALWELYDIPSENWLVTKAGSGHINETYIAAGNQQSWIVQKLNHRVFTQPEAIEQNIRLCQAYLQEKDHNYLFLAPLLNKKRCYTTKIADSYWRIFPFISDGIAFDTLSDPKQAYQAAKKFGELSRLLDGVTLADFKETIPAFHDLSLRFKQFEQALIKAPEQLKEAAAQAIALALAHREIAETFEKLKKTLPLRIQHHDTKISNVLLHHESYAAVCVIDLDTLMPGYFLSDVGDMMRTYLCAYDENESDLEKITTKTAGILLETIQGGAGFIEPQNNFLKKVRQRCDEVGAVMILDEIQPGFGRTGHFFGFEHFNVKPDIIVMGKGMGGGLPVGAFTASRELMKMLEDKPKLGHITTFGGNPLIAASCLATLRVIRDSKLMQEIPEKEALFRFELNHTKIK